MDTLAGANRPIAPVCDPLKTQDRYQGEAKLANDDDGCRGPSDDLLGHVPQ
jgi:hypothetical protein